MRCIAYLLQWSKKWNHVLNLTTGITKLRDIRKPSVDMRRKAAISKPQTGKDLLTGFATNRDDWPSPNHRT